METRTLAAKLNDEDLQNDLDQHHHQVDVVLEDAVEDVQLCK